ncbi:oligosaccharide flippase family protein [Vulcanisaeta distributa]|uniref:Polysaccharide biosynthesis protein n=1 Tax=Vulcanisaeta distributa (strain DSM 14429 / JCM 11212 / NBRC 100878 / IC-017) TaxID=572478 RepID=E1QUB9_VULDI|nr:oligosaccharide flippase family protein [Vulcanisaeta distributa]ADN49845.1 polysaccharide biosynthesis protein [Vulcanisaeta distributa DSM 14429]
MKESPVSGVVFGYLYTAINYVFALAYVILLTRFIPLIQYGYFNTLMAMMGMIGLFFPTLGIDAAIAREGAMLHSRGLGIDDHYAALLTISLTVSTLYAAALIIAIPLYLITRIPSGYMGLVLVYAAYVVTAGINGALSAYLWMTGRLASQGMGGIVGNITFRSIEIALLVLLRSVYAIVIGMAMGQLATLAYYLAIVRHFVNPGRGVALIKRGFRGYLGLGIQNWLLGYLSSVSGYVITYVIYSFIGTTYVALYSLAGYMLGAITALGGAVTNVFGSRVAHALGSGLTDRHHLIRDYTVAAISVSGVLATGAILAAPLLPLLGIIHGDYVEAIPYGIALFGTAVLGSVNSIYSMYYWVSGRGWVALEVSSVGIAVNVASALTLLIIDRGLGLYSVIIAAYLGSLAPLIIYLLIGGNPHTRDIAVNVTTYLFLSIAGALSYILIIDSWPLYQLAIFIVTVLVTYIMRPIPRSVIDQLPGLVRPLLMPFTEMGE